MANCCVVSGLLTLVAGFITASVSFVAPFWLRNDSWQEEQGLWGVCYQKRDLYREYWWRSCQWFFEDDFAWENHLPGWWKASQIIFAFAVVVLLATFLVACFHMCCAWQRYNGLSFAIAGLVAASLLLISISMGIFGIMAEAIYEVDIHGNFTYRWAFYVGQASIILLTASFICYLVTGCKERRRGYQKAPMAPGVM